MIENILPRSFRSSLMVIFLTGVLPTSFLFADSNEAYPELRKILRNLDSEVERYKTLYHKQVEDAKTLESQGYTAKAKRRLKKLGSLDDHIQSKLPIIEKKFIRPYIGKVYSFEATKGKIDDVGKRIDSLNGYKVYYEKQIKYLNKDIRDLSRASAFHRKMFRAFKGRDVREEIKKRRKERNLYQRCLKTHLKQKPYKEVKEDTDKIDSIIEQMQEYDLSTSEKEHHKNILYKVKYKMGFYIFCYEKVEKNFYAYNYDYDSDTQETTNQRMDVYATQTMKPVGAILAGRKLTLKQLSNKRFMQKIKKEIDEEKRIKELEERKAREQKEEAERIKASRIFFERIEASRKREKEAKAIIEAGYQRVSFYFDLGLGTTFGNFTGSDFSVSSPDKNSFFFHGHLSMGMKFWYLIIYGNAIFQTTSFDRVLEGSYNFPVGTQIETKKFTVPYELWNSNFSLGAGIKTLLGKSGVYLVTDFHPVSFFKYSFTRKSRTTPCSYTQLARRECDRLANVIKENLNNLRGISFLGGIGFTPWSETAFLSASIEGFVYLTRFQNWDIFYGVKASFGYF